MINIIKKLTMLIFQKILANFNSMKLKTTNKNFTQDKANMTKIMYLKPLLLLDVIADKKVNSIRIPRVIKSFFFILQY